MYNKSKEKTVYPIISLILYLLSSLFLSCAIVVTRKSVYFLEIGRDNGFLTTFKMNNQACCLAPKGVYPTLYIFEAGKKFIKNGGDGEAKFPKFGQTF